MTIEQQVIDLLRRVARHDHPRWEVVGRQIVDLVLTQAPQTLCGAEAVFWPQTEQLEATCLLPRGHQPSHRHMDETLGWWDENETSTLVRSDE